MTVSRIVQQSGNSVFEINGKVFPPCAYITYFEERNDYKQFADAGYRLFSVTVSFASQPINTLSEFMPYYSGMFDKKGAPDFTVADESIRLILKECPDAYIFPRIYAGMPQWWIDENPSEVNPVQHNKAREALYSEKYRKDAAEMIRQMIEHFENADFADRIFAYQITGGNTQEWFHFDKNGGYHPNALPYFNEFLKNKYPELYPLDTLPEIDEKYLEFANESVADTIEYLCKAAKQAVDYKKIIGVFYGYTMEVVSALWGTHKLSKLLDSENIDFFSSPNSYAFARALGEEWGDMMPVDSIRLHNKFCFIENDIRTCLSKSPRDSRIGCDPHDTYVTAVWDGPPTEKLSIAALIKSFARQLTHKHGLWWFDMFGHWYSSEKMMAEMKTYLETYSTLSDIDTDTQVAVFIDETMYYKINENLPMIRCAKNMRHSIAKSGAPYHIYLMEDFEKLTKEDFGYKAVVFAIPIDSKLLSDAISYCDQNDINYLRFDSEKYEFTPKEYRDFFQNSGVWCYIETDDIFYIGNGYFAIHAAAAGEKTIRFPQKINVASLNDSMALFTDTLQIQMEQFETRLFKIK